MKYQISVIFLFFFIFLPIFSDSRTARTERRTNVYNGSNAHADMLDVLLWGLLHARLNVRRRQKTPNFWHTMQIPFELYHRISLSDVLGHCGFWYPTSLSFSTIGCLRPFSCYIVLSFWLRFPIHFRLIFSIQIMKIFHGQSNSHQLQSFRSCLLSSLHSTLC